MPISVFIPPLASQALPSITPKGAQVNVVAMAIPFHFDASGMVATTNDLGQQAADRVLGLVGTAPTERVMLNAYGTPLRNALFESVDQMSVNILATQVKTAINLYEPGVSVNSVVPTTTDNSTISLAVDMNLIQTGQQRTATISVGGTVTETTTS